MNASRAVPSITAMQRFLATEAIFTKQSLDYVQEAGLGQEGAA
ncbi:hypothetical protein [Dokdonella sp.]